MPSPASPFAGSFYHGGLRLELFRLRFEWLPPTESRGHFK